MTLDSREDPGNPVTIALRNYRNITTYQVTLRSKSHNCHGFHTVGPKTSYETLSGIPCRKCHGNIFRIYEKSVHGTAKARGEHKAPLCSSCHFAHEVKFTAMTDKIKSACLGCHKDTEALHRKWLPNSDLHLSMVACAACHAPASGKGIYLQFFDRTTGAPISEEQILEFLGTDSASLSERLNAHSEGVVRSLEFSGR